MATQYHQKNIKTNGCSMIFIFANVWFFMIFSMYMNFRKRRILSITGDVEKKVKISMTIGEVPKVRILNISKDQEQKLMFSMVCGREGAGRMRIGIGEGAALPQTPNQRKTWKPEALIADT